MKKISTLLLSLSFYAQTILANPSQNLDTAREILLPDFQYSQLKKDFPITDILLDNGNSLWITGQKNLWRWQLSNNKMEKINLIKKNDSALQSITTTNDEMFVVSATQIFRLTFNPLQVSSLKIEGKRKQTVKLLAFNNRLIWVTTSGIYTTDPGFERLVRLKNSPSLTLSDKILYPKKNTLWIARKNRLLKLSFDNKKLTTTLLINTKNQLQNIFSSKDSGVFSNTRYTVLRFTKSGKLIQSIPVEEGRKLALININDNFHSYLFNDKLLEVYQIHSKKSFKYKLNLGIVHKAQKMIQKKSIIGLLIDGKPRIFQLSGKW